LAATAPVGPEAGLVMKSEMLDDIYDRYQLNDGSYPLTLFVGRKLQ
jgi:hypothetical protein